MSEWRDADFEFEADLLTAFTGLVDTDVKAVQLWESLTNQDWVNPVRGLRGSLTFRGADDAVGEHRSGYWYCSGKDGTLHAWVVKVLAQHGWVPETDSPAENDGHTNL